jgi:hypothetical protein
MSSDPSIPGDATVRSGGFVVRNMVYENKSGGANLEILSHWRAAEGTREFDQLTVPPYRKSIPKHHPCRELNMELERCFVKLDPQMRLAGRCAACNVERQKLMQCFTKNKEFDEELRLQAALLEQDRHIALYEARQNDSWLARTWRFVTFQQQ